MNQNEAMEFILEPRLMQLGEISMIFCQPDIYKTDLEIKVVAKKFNIFPYSSKGIRKFTDGWNKVAEALEVIEKERENDMRKYEEEFAKKSEMKK